MFSKIGATVSNKYHVQLQKSICCNKKSEAATIGILLKKTCNFIRESLHLFWKSSVNGCFWKSPSQWQISRREVISDFFYPLVLHVTWFAKVCLLFLSQKSCNINVSNFPLASYNSWQKVQDFSFLNGTIYIYTMF